MDRVLLAEWRNLVNMSADEIEAFLKTPEGKRAGLSRSEAQQQGIRSGQDSARAIIRMKRKDPRQWTSAEWEWARRQVGFIKRMSGNRGKLLDDKGRPTRKLLSLWVWGHAPDPEPEPNADEADLSWVIRPRQEKRVGRERIVRGSWNRNGILYLRSEYGSHRFILIDGRRPVAGLQVVERGDGTAVAATVYVLPEYRRQGIASRLQEAALDVFDDIEHDPGHLTGAGRAWSRSLRNPPIGDMVPADELEELRLYHGTSDPENADAIIHEGYILPEQDEEKYETDIPRWQSQAPQEGRVYVTRDLDVARKYAGEFGTVFEVEVGPRQDVALDEDEVGAMIATQDRILWDREPWLHELAKKIGSQYASLSYPDLTLWDAMFLEPAGWTELEALHADIPWPDEGRNATAEDMIAIGNLVLEQMTQQQQRFLSYAVDNFAVLGPVRVKGIVEGMGRNPPMRGGYAEKLGWALEDYDQEQLRIGTQHELEHTDDEEVAAWIAADHLAEQVLEGKPQDYYTQIAKLNLNGFGGFVKEYWMVDGDLHEVDDHEAWASQWVEDHEDELDFELTSMDPIETLLKHGAIRLYHGTRYGGVPTNGIDVWELNRKTIERVQMALLTLGVSDDSEVDIDVTETYDGNSIDRLQTTAGVIYHAKSERDIRAGATVFHPNPRRPAPPDLSSPAYEGVLEQGKWRAWYWDGKWHNVARMRGHEAFASQLFEPVMGRSSSGLMIEAGGIKQWGMDFVFQGKPGQLQTIQDRVVDMVKAGYRGNFYLSFGRDSYVEATASDVLEARSLRDLDALRRNGVHIGFRKPWRSWYWKGEWIELPANEFHDTFAMQLLGIDPEPDVSVQDPAMQAVLERGGIRQWGLDFVVWKLTKNALQNIQDRILQMSQEDTVDPRRHMVILSDQETGQQQLFPLAEVLEARSRRDLFG